MQSPRHGCAGEQRRTSRRDEQVGVTEIVRMLFLLLPGSLIMIHWHGRVKDGRAGRRKGKKRRESSAAPTYPTVQSITDQERREGGGGGRKRKVAARDQDWLLIYRSTIQSCYDVGSVALPDLSPRIAICIETKAGRRSSPCPPGQCTNSTSSEI